VHDCNGCNGHTGANVVLICCTTTPSRRGMGSRISTDHEDGSWMITSKRSLRYCGVLERYCGHVAMSVEVMMYDD